MAINLSTRVHQLKNGASVGGGVYWDGNIFKKGDVISLKVSFESWEPPYKQKHILIQGGKQVWFLR